MNAFLIFDPQNSLIFVHCNQKFEQFVLQSHGHDAQWPVGANGNEVLHNLITLHLTPYVSVHRQVAHSTLRLDSLPDTCIVHKTWQQFVFLHLYRAEISEQPVDDVGLYLFLQRKVTIFSRVALFLFGNALYNIEKHEHNLKILLKLLAKWDSLNMEVPFLVESIEMLFLGFHMEGLQRKLVSRVEQLMKRVQMSDQGANAVRETPTCCLVLYKNKLLYKHESATSRLCQEDMLSVLLLTLSVQLYTGPGSDVSSEGSNLDESVTGDRTCSHFQQLVFLSSSHNYQIPVPHIYRKVMIAEDLCFVSLAEVSSLLMISLPTLMQTVTDLKLNLTLHKLSSKKSIENLTNCVRNLHKYINKDVCSILPPQHEFNFGPFEQLNELARKASHSPTELVCEQADRILTMVLGKLHECYDDVAFKNLFLKTFPLHMQIYETVAQEVSDLMVETFGTCLDYIHVKHDTSHLVIAAICEQYPNLEVALFVDRVKGHFLIGSLEGGLDKANDVLSDFILQAYEGRTCSEDPLITWSDGDHRFAYICYPHTQYKSTRVATCDIARIFESEGSTESFDQLAGHSSFATYELFCVFKESGLNAEQISQNNIEKLIKLYINR